MLRIALVLAEENPAYEDIATKFFEHFIYIADAINNLSGTGLWNEADGFYYDILKLPDGRCTPMRAHSIVGLIPLFAITTDDPQVPTRFPDFARRVRWFMKYRPELAKNIANIDRPGVGARALLALVSPEKLRRILTRALDESRLLSPYGIRSVSKRHREHPFVFQADGKEYKLDYEPAESTTGVFGGNSNWRGPVWFPLNYLLIESLQQFHYYLGGDYQVECPTGSGQEATLWEVATELSRRLLEIFLKDESGRRPLYGGIEKFQTDPHWRDLILFHEYFHGDNGAGLGAGHQTGWTGLIAKLIQQYGEYCLQDKPPQLREKEE
jgi:hypothetical protein